MEKSSKENVMVLMGHTQQKSHTLSLDIRGQKIRNQAAVESDIFTNSPSFTHSTVKNLNFLILLYIALD